jgi:hypothetical protein
MRIRRYMNMLREAGSDFISISHDPYVDLNMGRYDYSELSDHFPQFETLLEAIQEYEVVFTDIVETPRSSRYRLLQLG